MRHCCHGSFNQPAAKHNGSPNPGNQDSNNNFGPHFSSQRLRRPLRGSSISLKLLRAITPSHQSTIPPNVLPTVATMTATQNKWGFRVMYPKRIGSEPAGIKVAEINELINTAGKPTDGISNHAKKWSNKCSIRRKPLHLPNQRTFPWISSVYFALFWLIP